MTPPSIDKSTAEAAQRLPLQQSSSGVTSPEWQKQEELQPDVEVKTGVNLFQDWTDKTRLSINKSAPFSHHSHTEINLFDIDHHGHGKHIAETAPKPEKHKDCV